MYLQLVNGIFNNFTLTMTLSIAEINHFYIVFKQISHLYLNYN